MGYSFDKISEINRKSGSIFVLEVKRKAIFAFLDTFIKKRKKSILHLPGGTFF